MHALHPSPPRSGTTRFAPFALAPFALLAASGAAWGQDRTLPAVTVTPVAESPAGPVTGYRAERSITGKTDLPLRETPQSITVIGREQMEDQGATNVQDTLRYTAGVYSNTYGFDNRGDWALIRGTSFAQYQDGLRMLFGFYNNVRPDPWMLERVEVLKGPSSVAYGQGNFGGIVNLIAKRPLATPLRQVELQLGSYSRRQLALDLTGPLNAEGTLLYRLVALGRDSGTQVDHVPDDRRLLAPSLTWRPDARAEVRLYAQWQDDRSGSSVGFFPWAGTLLPAPLGRIPTRTFISEPGFDDFSAEQKALGLEARWQFNDTFTLHHHLRKMDSGVRYRSLYSRFAPRPALNADNRTINRTIYVADNDADALTADTRLEARWRNGALESTVMAGRDLQDVAVGSAQASANAPAIDVYSPVYGNFTPLAPGVRAVTDQRQSGLYVQYQGRWAERWILLAGLRRDHAQSDTAGAPAARLDTRDTTGRLALAYAHPAGWTPYVSWSESFVPIVGVNLFGLPYRPQTARMAEAGIKYELPGGGATFTAAAFDIRETNRRTPDPANPGNQVQAGEARSRGFELEATGAVTRQLDLIATYSRVDTEVTRSNGPDLGKRLASVPENQATVWGRYKMAIGPGLLSLGAGVRYVGSSWDGADLLETPSHTLLDAMAAYETGPWKAALTVNNLADKVHVTTCLARGDCFYGSRRQAVLSVRYSY
jgi:iron complex outermembrane recepter protein